MQYDLAIIDLLATLRYETMGYMLPLKQHVDFRKCGTSNAYS